MSIFKWLWKYIRKYKFNVFTGFLLIVFSSLLTLVPPYAQKIVVDDVIKGNSISLLTVCIIAMVGATMLKAVLKYALQMIFENVSQNIIYKLREDIYTGMHQMDFEFFDKTKTGDIMARMTGDIDAVRHFIAWVIYTVFENAIVFISVSVMLFVINVKLTLILLAVMPFIAYLTMRMGKSIRPAFAAIREQFSKLNSVVQENVSGNRVVKAFAREEYETGKFSLENEAYRQKNIAAASLMEKYMPVLDSMPGLLLAVILLAGGILVINDSLTLGELVAFNGLAWALNTPMRMISLLVNDVQRFAASAEKIISILSIEPKVKNSANATGRSEIEGYIRFSDVSFSYGDEEVLNNISFEAKPGQSIAIIGPTGSGKTTLVNLICRFYDCNCGEITIDNINIRNMDIGMLRSNIAGAMQDVFLFSDTIEGNIAYGVPSATMEQVKRAADIAGAHEFISGMPEGYDTVVGERGVGLSGGQKQRIALARALLKNPSILILDDTTSSVDIETEMEIHKTLKSFNKSRTTFIIAHRISSVKHADMILVLEDGRIIERGTHEELLGRKGHYYSVFINQYGDFDNIYSSDTFCGSIITAS